MLDDRYYLRQPTDGHFVWSAWKILMAINIGIFALTTVIEYYAPSFFGDLMAWTALSLAGIKSFFLWQLVTFQFLHGGILHLLVNMLVLYVFGSVIEAELGSKRFTHLYFASGIIGGIVQILFLLLIPAQFNAQVVGASAGCMGLVAAFATLFPDRILTLLVLFIFPVSMRARTLLWISIGLAVLGILAPKDNIADAAHLGGILTGCAYVLWFVQGHSLPQWWPSAPRRKARQLVNVTGTKGVFWQKNPPEENDEAPSSEFISREVDPILDKISAHGIQSLTDRERRVLERARAKMAKR